MQISKKHMLLYRAHCDAEERQQKGEVLPFNCAFNSKLLSAFKLQEVSTGNHSFSFIAKVSKHDVVSIQQSIKVKQLGDNVHKLIIENEIAVAKASLGKLVAAKNELANLSNKKVIKAKHGKNKSRRGRRGEEEDEEDDEEIEDADDDYEAQDDNEEDDEEYNEYDERTKAATLNVSSSQGSIGSINGKKRNRKVKRDYQVEQLSPASQESGEIQVTSLQNDNNSKSTTNTTLPSTLHDNTKQRHQTKPRSKQCANNSPLSSDKVEGSEQTQCCLTGCSNGVTNRLRFSLRCHNADDFKETYINAGWNKVCHYHYFSDLYKYKKMNNGSPSAAASGKSKNDTGIKKRNKTKPNVVDDDEEEADSVASNSGSATGNSSDEDLSVRVAKTRSAKKRKTAKGASPIDSVKPGDVSNEDLQAFCGFIDASNSPKSE